jgi:hypothetical protein
MHFHLGDDLEPSLMKTLADPAASGKQVNGEKISHT